MGEQVEAVRSGEVTLAQEDAEKLSAFLDHVKRMSWPFGLPLAIGAIRERLPNPVDAGEEW